eukprot:10680428-Lingulodinium_polyedra.AAC.1
MCLFVSVEEERHGGARRLCSAVAMPNNASITIALKEPGRCDVAPQAARGCGRDGPTPGLVSRVLVCEGPTT